MMGTQRGKDGTRATLQRVQTATASLGRFDEKVSGEPGKKKQRVKKGLNRAVGGEGELAILRQVLRGEKASKTREKKRRGNKEEMNEYEGLVPSRRDGGFKGKKGRGSKNTRKGGKRKR